MKQPQRVERTGPSRLLTSMVASALPDVREPGMERNEGHKVAIDHKIFGDVVAIGLDVSKAPVPPRRYAAEVCSVSVMDGSLRLVFGQRMLGEDDRELDSALVIRLAPHAAHNFVETVSSMRRPGLRSIAEQMKIEPAPLLERVPRPAQMANMVANMAAVGVSGHESCIDFYHASPFAMRNVEHKDHIQVEPVVRVDLATSILLSLLAKAEELVAGLPAPVERGPE